METKANYLVIGLAVLGLIGFAFGFVYWITHSGSSGASAYYQIVFKGSVSGLNRSSKVLYNGIHVGSVTGLELDATDPRNVRVTLRVDNRVPIKTDSMARLEFQGLTGIASVQITGGTAETPMLTAKAGEEFPIIKSDSAGQSSLFDAAPNALNNANALFVRLNELLARNEDSITKTIKSVEKFSGMLEENSDDIEVVIKDVRELTGRLKSVAEKLEKAAGSVNAFLSDEDSALVHVEEAAKSFRKLAKKLEKTVDASSSGIKRFTTKGLREFEGLMRDSRKAVRTFDRVLEGIERDPQKFIFGNSKSRQYNPGR